MPPNNPMTEGEALARAQFETWAKSRGRSTNTWVETGEYSHYDTQRCWQAWRAALTAHTAASGGEVVAWALFDPMGGKPEILTCKERPYSLDNWQPLYRHPPAAVPADALTVDDAMVERACVAAAEASEAEWPAEYTATELAELRETMRAALTAALIPKGADHEQR